MLTLFFSCDRYRSEKDILPFKQVGNYALSKIKQTEILNDSTCWTTARMMDQFAEGKKIFPPASIVKLELLKELITLILINSRAITKKSYIGLNDIEISLKPFLNNQKPSPIWDLNLKAFGQLSDGWKTIFSVINESSNFKIPIEKKALDKLAQVYPILSLKLLSDAKKESDKKFHREIEINDFKSAFVNMSYYPQENIPRKKSTLRSSRKYISDKISSLVSWNKGEDNEKFVLQQINKLLRRPLTQNALDEIFKIGVNFAKYVGIGYEGITSSLNLSISFLRYFSYDGAKTPIWIYIMSIMPQRPYSQETLEIMETSFFIT
jgi:hypothetical protein